MYPNFRIFKSLYLILEKIRVNYNFFIHVSMQQNKQFYELFFKPNKFFKHLSYYTEKKLFTHLASLEQTRANNPAGHRVLRKFAL